MTIITTVYLGEEGWLELEELAHACGVEPELIAQLVAEGLLEPGRSFPGADLGALRHRIFRALHRFPRLFVAGQNLPALLLAGCLLLLAAHRME